MLHINNLRLPKFNLNNSAELTVVRLFFVLSLAFFEMIWAVYLKQFEFSDSQIGYLSSVLILVSIIFIFFCVNLLEKISEYKSFVFSSILIFLSLISLGFFNSIYIIIPSILVLAFANILRMNSFSISFRDSIAKGKLNSAQAMLSVIGNIGWFLGPILAGFIFRLYGISMVFYISSIFSLFSLIMFLKIPFKPVKRKKYIKKSFKKIISIYINKPGTKLPYLVSVGISFWWSFMFLYIPLFIIKSDLPLEYIGIFIGLTQIPLIFFEYFVGKKSEKSGFRNLFIIGFLGLGFSGISSFFISDVLIILGIFILASFFMALVEPLRYSYIFSKIKQSEEEDIIPLFSSSLSIGGLLNKLAVASLLIYLPFKFSFLFLGLVMFLIGLIIYFSEDR